MANSERRRAIETTGPRLWRAAAQNSVISDYTMRSPDLRARSEFFGRAAIRQMDIAVGGDQQTVIQRDFAVGP
jgi:hypothetical protein